MASFQHPRVFTGLRWIRHFGDFDEMAHHISAWDVGYEQLSPGRFQAEVAMSTSPRMQILTLLWNRALSNLVPHRRAGDPSPFRLAGTAVSTSAASRPGAEP